MFTLPGESEEEGSEAEDEIKSSDDDNEENKAMASSANKEPEAKPEICKDTDTKQVKVIMPERLQSGITAMTSGRSEANGAMEATPDLPYTFVAPSTHEVFWSTSPTHTINILMLFLVSGSVFLTMLSVSKPSLFLTKSYQEISCSEDSLS